MTRAERAYRIVSDVRTFLVVVIILLLVVVLVPIRQNRLTNERLKNQLASLEDIAAVNRENNDRIKDCVTPTGRCYRESAKRTADALAQLQRYTDAANICTLTVRPSSVDTVDEIAAAFRVCINDQLKKGVPGG